MGELHSIFHNRKRINMGSKCISVVHVTTIDIGGAYKAVSRISQCMKSEQVKSYVLVRTKTTEQDSLQECFSTSIERMISKGKNVFNALLRKKNISRDIWGTDISKNFYISNADIIFLHWTNSFLSIKTIRELLNLGKPIIWVMHDMWLFTGGCHVNAIRNMYCERYTIGCGKCPLAGSKKEYDISKKNYLDKQRLFLNHNIIVTGPSNWIVECAKKSPILKSQDIRYIPNCYNESIFHNLYIKEECYNKYNVHTDKKIILFGAVRNTQDGDNKGAKCFIEALSLLPADQYYVLIFGNVRKNSFSMLKQEYHLLGYIVEENDMAEIYNMADVFVSPSKQESFGYTVCEAMACGIPVVANAVGGIKDQIIHKENGYLVKEQNSEDFAMGIQYCIENKERLQSTAEITAKRFAYTNMRNIYLSLIQEIVK